LKVLGAMKDYVSIGNFKGKNVYYLNKKGRDLIGSENEVSWTLQLEHYLMRNDLFIHYGCPKSWVIEKKVSYGTVGTKEHYVIPDARFKNEHNIWTFIEVDRIQTMSENRKKIERYAELSPIMQSQGQKPTIVFYTLRSSRKEKLNALCKEAGLDCVIYTQEELL
jgi:hypothetical protein